MARSYRRLLRVRQHSEDVAAAGFAHAQADLDARQAAVADRPAIPTAPPHPDLPQQWQMLAAASAYEQRHRDAQDRQVQAAEAARDQALQVWQEHRRRRTQAERLLERQRSDAAAARAAAAQRAADELAVTRWRKPQR